MANILNFLSGSGLLLFLSLAFVVALVHRIVYHRDHFDHSGYSKAVSDTIVNSIISAKAWMYAFFSSLQRSPTV